MRKYAHMQLVSLQALHMNLTFKYFTKVEGKHAIDSPGMPKSAEVPPEEYLLEENEERSMIEPKVGEQGEVDD